jgi:hypothetical protein
MFEPGENPGLQYFYQMTSNEKQEVTEEDLMKNTAYKILILLYGLSAKALSANTKTPKLPNK